MPQDSRIASEGPVLSERTFTTRFGEVLVRKLPDDPECLRVSLGGTAAAGYYLTYRGSEKSIADMLIAAIATWSELQAPLTGRKEQS